MENDFDLYSFVNSNQDIPGRSYVVMCFIQRWKP